MIGATRKLLLDVRDAGESVLQHTAEKNLAEYSANGFFRRAVERDGYDTVDDRVVWGIVEKDLPRLVEEVGSLLDADGAAA